MGRELREKTWKKIPNLDRREYKMTNHFHADVIIELTVVVKLPECGHKTASEISGDGIAGELSYVKTRLVTEVIQTLREAEFEAPEVSSMPGHS